MPKDEDELDDELDFDLAELTSSDSDVNIVAEDFSPSDALSPSLSDVSLDDESLSDDSGENLKSAVSELGLAEPTGEKASGAASAVAKSTSKTAAKPAPAKTAPSAVKNPAKPAPTSAKPTAALDPKLASLFDQSAQLTSTARQHVEAAYKTVDPNDSESRRQAREALRQSLTTFAKKAIDSGALSSQQVAALFESANNFAGALLLVRREKSA